MSQPNNVARVWETNGTVDKSKNTGNLAKQTISFDGLAQPFVQTYKYDSLYRITEAKETNNGNQTWIQNFGYDRYGNRTTLSQNILGQQLAINKFTHPTINPNTNRFDNGQDYAYDKVGNLIADADDRSFTFDGNNKQILVTNVNSQSVGEYFYDGNGKRVKKKRYVGGGLAETVIFVYSGGKLVEEYSTKTPPTNPQTKYVATDHLESIRALSNQDGEIISRRDFLPFGEELQTDTNYRKSNFKYNSDDVRHKFTSYEKDKETGLDFAQARMYNNRHARFTAVDPLLASGKSSNPQTFNRYIYAMNSPLQYVDPDGLQSGKWYDRGSELNPIYVPNSQGMVNASWKEITTKNSRGSLVYDGQGVPEGYQVRLNRYGPLDTGNNFWQDLGNLLVLSDYDIKGWDIVRNDTLFKQYMMTGAVETAITPFDVAIAVTPIKRVGGFTNKATSKSSIIESPRLANFSFVRKYWGKPKTFKGSKVYQRNDIFDPTTISTWKDKGKTVTGTNVERMASGRAPIGIDGKSVDLHHMLQTNTSPIAEMTNTFHKSNHRIIHINPNTIKSGINRPEFGRWRKSYWENRANDFK